MSKKCKVVCMTLNCIEHFLVSTFAVTRFISISAFASKIGIPVKFTGYAIGSIICAKTAKKLKCISQ